MLENNGLLILLQKFLNKRIGYWLSIDNNLLEILLMLSAIIYVGEHECDTTE